MFPIPATLEDYCRLLAEERWQHYLSYDGGELSARCLRVADGSLVTVFYDPQFLAVVNTNEFYMDATFKVCPRQPLILQLFTIMARIHDSVGSVTASKI